MIIREANTEDLEDIISVLKASLGETSSKKTSDVWKYKHVANPFGKSLVLVAEEDGEIIGVRAFMRWKWQLGSQTFSAFRAVDTATHPDHQGKGIFKKLTLKALELAEQAGDHFVFNTPNSQSKPGYLKMGWQEVGKVRTQIIPQSPFRFLQTARKTPIYDHGKPLNDLSDLLKIYDQRRLEEAKIYTPKSMEYLTWRYSENKIQQYFISSDQDHYVAAYLKDRGKILELRISEMIFVDQIGKDKIRKFINQLSSQYKANIISHNSLEKFSNFQIKGNFGPVLTFKNITCKSKDYEKFLEDSSWNYTIGDLELF